MPARARGGGPRMRVRVRASGQCTSGSSGQTASPSRLTIHATPLPPARFRDHSGGGTAKSCHTIELIVMLEQQHYERLLDFRTGLRRLLRWTPTKPPRRDDSGSATAAARHPRASGPGGPDHPRGGGVPAGATSQRGRAGRQGGGGRTGRAAPGRRRFAGGAACLTAAGADRLARLSAVHLEELRWFAPQLPALWDGLDMSL